MARDQRMLVCCLRLVTQQRIPRRNRWTAVLFPKWNRLAGGLHRPCCLGTGCLGWRTTDKRPTPYKQFREFLRSVKRPAQCSRRCMFTKRNKVTHYCVLGLVLPHTDVLLLSLSKRNGFSRVLIADCAQLRRMDHMFTFKS